MRLFSFRTEEGRHANVEEENEILQKDIEENSNNLVQKQEQVAVSSIASVVKLPHLRAVHVKVEHQKQKQQHCQ